MPKLSEQSLLLPHQDIHLVLPQMLHYQMSVNKSSLGQTAIKYYSIIQVDSLLLMGGQLGYLSWSNDITAEA